MFSPETIAVLVKFAIGMAILICGLVITKIVMVILRKALKRSSADEVIYTFICKCVQIACLVIVCIATLGYYEVPTAPVVTVLGAAGAAVALALKDSLGNIAGGMLILFNKPFTKGDFVAVNGYEGTVEKTDLFNTTIIGDCEQTIIIPNGVLTASVLSNYSRENKRKGSYSFGISYTADIAKAKEIIKKVAYDCPYSIEKDKITVGVIEQADSAVILSLKVWAKTNEHILMKQYIMENVKLAFDQENIEIPFNQLDVHIKEK